MPKVMLLLRGGNGTQGQLHLVFQSCVLTPLALPSPCDEGMFSSSRCGLGEGLPLGSSDVSWEAVLHGSLGKTPNLHFMLHPSPPACPGQKVRTEKTDSGSVLIQLVVEGIKGER